METTLSKLLDCLACPQCGASLETSQGKLVCPGCKLWFSTHEDITLLCLDYATDIEEKASSSYFSFLDSENPQFLINADGTGKDMQGVAIYKYIKGMDTEIVAERDDGKITPVEFKNYFSSYDQLYPYEKQTLAHLQGRVLDLATGAGKYARAAQHLGFQVIGCDFSPLSIYVARETGLQVGVVGSAHELPFRPQLFDTIFVSDIGWVCNNLVLLKNFLQYVMSYLSPQGVLILTSRNPHFIKKKEYQQRNQDNGLYFGHYRYRYASSQLTRRWRSGLLLEPEILAECGQHNGWKQAALYQEMEKGYYAAVFARA